MKTAEEIFDEMKTVFAEKSGYEVSDNCDMGVRMYAAAAQTEALYIYGQWITRQCFPQTAEGEYLDGHGKARGIERKGAQKAKGTVSFSISRAVSENIPVPAGTVCMTAGGIAFETTEVGVIPAGELFCTVPAQAVEAGKAGNAGARTVIFFAAPPVGIEACVNSLPFTGGSDEETDEDYRERILDSYKTLPNGANAGWYKKIALETEGVAACSVVPCSRGTGTVDVIIASDDGMPTAELLASVQAAFEEQREICVDVSVIAPLSVTINIDADVKVKSGYDEAAVLLAVDTAVKELFAKVKLGRKLYMAEICDCIYHVDGVESYRLNSPDFNYIAEHNTLVTLGNVIIRGWN